MMNDTVLFEAVIRVLADWKMKTALESPFASKVRVPVSESVGPVYTPATKVRPPSSLAAAPGPLLAASL